IPFLQSSLARPESRCCRSLSSSLFPYTTLFRSNVNVQYPHGYNDTALYFANRYLTPLTGNQTVPASGTENVRVYLENVYLKKPRDRKSTRLNSSHVKTSYAVFCLKKKTLAQAIC